MKFEDIESLIQTASLHPNSEVRWCNSEEHFLSENSPDSSPGFKINEFGYYIIGTTIGGNAISYCPNDDTFKFCDHTGWYEDFMSYESENEEYIESPYSKEAVSNAQVLISSSKEQFLENCKNGKLELQIEALD